MQIFRQSLSQSRVVAASAVLVAVACAGACSSGSSSSTGSTSSPPSASTSSSTTGAASSSNPALAAAYKGTLHSPSTASRPGAKNKKLVIISSGQSSISSSVPVDAAQAAAKALGWQVTVYDAENNSANYANLVSQAISSGANGIILDAIDCSYVKSQLEQAKAKHIFVVPIYAYDCNDPHAGKGGVSLFSAPINYGAAANKNLGAFAEQYGFAQGQAVIQATDHKAKVIFFNDPTTTVLYYTGLGFTNAIKTCSGCSIVATVNFTALDLGPTLQQKAASVLLQHPEANAVKSPFTAATLLSIAPAVQQSGRASKLYVMGGEGFAPELDLLRNNAGVDAVMIAPSDWTGWAAVDTMNSLFTGKKPAYSGLGWELVDRTHNLPASGAFVPPVDFKSIYEKAWGVG